MKKNIAFFDFDGTITTKDTMLELARFTAGNFRYFAGMAAISPWLIAMKFSLVSKISAKEKLLTYFFAGMPVDEFDKKCQEFTTQMLPALIKKEAMAAIDAHRASDTAVVVVSASAENWVAPWCKQNNIQCIASRLELVDKKLTGKLYGENCNGIEKVSRIKELFNLADFNNVYCYGDTGGDTDMLAIATHPFYRCYQ